MRDDMCICAKVSAAHSRSRVTITTMSGKTLPNTVLDKRPPLSAMAIIGLVGLGMVWGLFFSLSRAAGETGVNPFSILAYTLLAEIPIFGMICYYRGRFPRIFRPASIIFYIVAALLGYMIPSILELYSAPMIGAGLLTILVSMTPIVTMIGAFMMKTDHINRRKILGVMLASIAMIPILISGDLDMPKPEMAGLGFVLALMVTCCYGLYHNVIAKFWPTGEDGWQLATGEVVVGSVVIIPAVTLINGIDVQPILDTGLYWIMACYVVLSASSISLYFYLQEKGGPIFVSLAGFVSLIAGVLFGMVFFGEEYPWWVVLSIILMIVAIWLTTSGSNLPKEQREGVT